MHVGTCVVRGQLLGVSSLLSPCARDPGAELGASAWRRDPLSIHLTKSHVRLLSSFILSFYFYLFFFETEYLHGDLCLFPHLTPADISEGICCLPCLGSLLLVKPTTLPGAPPGMALRAKATTLPEASRWGSFWFPGTRQRWLSS